MTLDASQTVAAAHASRDLQLRGAWVCPCDPCVDARGITERANRLGFCRKCGRVLAGRRGAKYCRTLCRVAAFRLNKRHCKILEHQANNDLVDPRTDKSDDKPCLAEASVVS